MKILLSGSSGYLGSGLLKRLVEEDHQVGVLTDSTPDFLLPWLSSAEVHHVDLSRPLRPELREDYEVFVHAAAFEEGAPAEQAQALLSTALSTRHVLDLCRDRGIRRFVHFSTFEVYGRAAGMIDADTAVSCKSEYALTHFFAEQYVRLARDRGVASVILRPTHLVGAPLHASQAFDTRPPGSLCREAVETGSIDLAGEGDRELDLISLDDLLGLTLGVVRDFEAFADRSLNLGSGESLSLRQIAQAVQRAHRAVFGRPCALMGDKPQASPPERLQVDVDWQRRLGWPVGARASLERELERTLSILLPEQERSLPAPAA